MTSRIVRTTILALAGAFLLLSGCCLEGCAGLIGAHAYHYRYSVATDGSKTCELDIDSGSVSQGASIDICNADGHATAGANALQAGPSHIGELTGLVAAGAAVAQQAIRGQPITIPSAPPPPPPPTIPPGGQ